MIDALRSIAKGPRCGPSFLAFALSLGLAGAHAGDRPFVATASAAAEEDDDQVWSVEAVFERRGRTRTFSLAPEYAFDPTTSVQFEIASVRERGSGGVRAEEAAFEVKHVFNHIARDGYGWGVVAEVGFERESGRAWRRGGFGVVLPFTLALWEGAGALHLNAGIEKPRGERRETLFAAGIEREVWRRTTLFAEAAREGDTRLLSAGVRWWAQREKIAIDLSVLRERGDGERRSGVVVGVGCHDL